MTSRAQYEINGVLSTNKTVLQNIQTLAEASGCFFTFDINTGKWCVVINQPGSSVASFNDSNIIGAISISGTGLKDFYNQVNIEFPHKDLLDETDMLIAKLDPSLLYPNESTNILNLSYDIFNDPVQAELIGITQLKQNRIDKIIQFETDFSMLGLKAGDIIDVTNSIYGYTNKLFRVINIEENDSDNGSISLKITALEYDAGVYDTTGVSRSMRTNKHGITAINSNTAIAADKVAGDTANLSKLLIPLAATSLFNWLFPTLAKDLLEALNNPAVTITGTDDICEGQTATVNVAVCCSSCTDLSTVKVDYEITGTGITAADIGVPLKGKIQLAADGTGSLEIPILNDGITEGNETLSITINKVKKDIIIHDPKTRTVTVTPTTVVEGGSATFTITTTGTPDGSYPYTLSGDGISSPLSGNVTITGGTGSVSVSTQDIDAIADRTVILNFDAGKFYCSSTSNPLTVTHTGTPPPEPPPTTNCNPVVVPYFWCPVYDPDGKVLRLDALSSVAVCSPQTGQPTITVPLTVSVTPGSPSTVTILTTATIDASTGKGGQKFDLITSFNSIPTFGIVTGTTTQVSGYQV